MIGARLADKGQLQAVALMFLTGTDSEVPYEHRNYITALLSLENALRVTGMTLIAAYSSSQTPVVTGDFLTTQGAYNGFCLRKKVHRITSNLAVAWTGTIVVAEHVVGALHRRFANESPTANELQQFLTSFKDGHFGTVRIELIGWIFDGEYRCFRWRSDWPQELFFGEPQYGGTGGPMIEAMLAQWRNVPFDNPARHVLQSIGRLMEDEVERHRNRTERFGFGYEALYGDGNAFTYVDDVLYLFGNVYFDAAGHYLRPEIQPKFFKYHSLSDDYALLQIESYIPRGGQFFVQIDRHLITPVYESWKARALAQQVFSASYPVPYDAKYSCFFINIVKDADTSNPQQLTHITYVSASIDSIKPFSVLFKPVSEEEPLQGELSVRFPPREHLISVYEDAIKASS